MPKLSYIIPCYFNEENIPLTSVELIKNEKEFPSDVSFEYVLLMTVQRIIPILNY